MAMPTTAERSQRAETPPRSDVMRTAPFKLRAAADDEPNDGRTLDGYGAVFNTLTKIDSWEGRFFEQIAAGSMKKTFRENPPKIQFDHGRHPLIGSIPVAELKSIAEEVDPERAPNGGAHVIGRLFDNWLIQPVRDAIKAQAIDGMSFRFSVVREEWHDPDGKKITDEKELRELLFRSWWEELPDEELLIRTLKELKVPEVGPVVWPAYAETSVDVRSGSIDLSRLTDPAERKKLSYAVLLADTAERTDQTDEAPDATEDDSADDHASDVDDTPRSTDAPSAGEHASVPLQRGKRAVDLALRHAREVLISIDAKDHTP
jgi:HK97 family phage prohead protease